MKFSIVIPIFNVSNYILDCLNSIVAQTFSDFEVILVNDGSTDNSEQICKKFCCDDSRFVLISKENGGLVSARKHGMLIAQGEYIVPIDGDDFISSDYLETFASIIERDNPEIIFSGFIKYYSDTKKDIKKTEIEEGVYLKDNYYKGTLDFFLYDSSLFPNQGKFLHNLCTKAIKRELYIKCQEKVPNRIKYGEDLLCTTFLLDAMNSFYVSSYCGYYYRQSDTSMCLHFKPEAFINYDTVIKYLLQTWLEKNKVYVFAFTNLFILISYFAKSCEQYSEFIKIINNSSLSCKCLWECALKAYIDKPNMKTRIKDILLQHKMYTTMYLLYRYLI